MPVDEEPAADRAVSTPDLTGYRAAVADLLVEIRTLVASGESNQLSAVDTYLRSTLRQPAFTTVLAATPGGTDSAITTLLHEVHGYRPSTRSSATDLVGLVRISLLSQIDCAWWGDAPAYMTDTDVESATDLVDLEPLRERQQIAFRYRRQPEHQAGRIRDALVRRVAGRRTPRTAGLKFARTRPEMVMLLHELTQAFAKVAPAGTPPLWVTSLTRSVQHQHRLRTLGYSALLPSGHCVGYATDIEMWWYRRFGADGALAALLLDYQARGDANVIDEGQAWHVCISPTAAGPLRRAFDLELGR